MRPDRLEIGQIWRTQGGIRVIISEIRSYGLDDTRRTGSLTFARSNNGCYIGAGPMTGLYCSFDRSIDNPGSDTHDLVFPEFVQAVQLSLFD
jgi:hypothetical protein